MEGCEENTARKEGRKEVKKTQYPHKTYKIYGYTGTQDARRRTQDAGCQEYTLKKQLKVILLFLFIL